MPALPQTQPNVNNEQSRQFSYIGGANQPRYPSFSPNQTLGSSLFTLPVNFDGLPDDPVAPPATLIVRALMGVGI